MVPPVRLCCEGPKARTVLFEGPVTAQGPYFLEFASRAASLLRFVSVQWCLPACEVLRAVLGLCNSVWRRRSCSLALRVSVCHFVLMVGVFRDKLALFRPLALYSAHFLIFTGNRIRRRLAHDEFNRNTLVPPGDFNIVGCESSCAFLIILFLLITILS